MAKEYQYDYVIRAFRNLDPSDHYLHLKKYRVMFDYSFFFFFFVNTL